MSRVAIVAAKRTPIGAFQGSLSSLQAPILGATSIKGCLNASGVDPKLVEEVRMGIVLSAGVGQSPARQAALKAGLPVHIPCTTINKVCGSGMRSVMDLCNAILAGSEGIAVGGGMESMSNAPYLLPNARKGHRMGNNVTIDSMIHDGLWDPYNDMHMGHCGEVCADTYGFTREMQDHFAEQSVLRAQKAVKDGIFKEEIVPVEVEVKGKKVLVDTDEQPSLVHVSKIPNLKPAFKKGGTVTAANASSINDGGAAVLLASESKVKELGLKPIAWIVGYAGHAQDPMWFTTAPSFACQKLISRLGLRPDDIDLWEINEAFALVAMACMKDLNIPHEKVNIHGGACSLGHPIGCSGVRLLVTLVHSLHRHQKKRGLATLCIGGGEATAVVVERAE